MFGYPILSVVCFGLAGALLVVRYAPGLVKAGGDAFGKLFTSTSTAPGTPVPADQDVTDLLAAKVLQARAKRLGCPEMTAAVVEILNHFFHGTSTP